MCMPIQGIAIIYFHIMPVNIIPIHYDPHLQVSVVLFPVLTQVVLIHAAMCNIFFSMLSLPTSLYILQHSSLAINAMASMLTLIVLEHAMMC